MTEYILVTDEQKKVLDALFKTLDITIEDLFGIKNIKELKEENKKLSERLSLCETALIESNKAIVTLNARTTEMATEISNMQREEMVWDNK